MDIESALRQVLEKSHTIEKFKEQSNGFSFTIRDSQKLKFKVSIVQFKKKTYEDIKTFEEIYYFNFKGLKNFDDFSNAFSVNIFYTLYEDIKSVKNQFNFLNNYFLGKQLEFETLTELLHSRMLRSERIECNFFVVSFNVHFNPQSLKFSIHFIYSYFDKNGSGVFEDNLHDFRLSFLKKYIVPLLDKPLEELRLEDHKILQMINI